MVIRDMWTRKRPTGERERIEHVENEGNILRHSERNGAEAVRPTQYFVERLERIESDAPQNEGVDGRGHPWYGSESREKDVCGSGEYSTLKGMGMYAHGKGGRHSPWNREGIGAGSR